MGLHIKDPSLSLVGHQTLPIDARITLTSFLPNIINPKDKKSFLAWTQIIAQTFKNIGLDYLTIKTFFTKY